MTKERLQLGSFKEFGVNKKIIDALTWVERNYEVPRDQMMISSGAAISLLLANIANPHFRPITDIDILINSDHTQPIPNLNPNILDLRSTPWGSVYLNPIITLDELSLQIDLLSDMYHVHLLGNENDPLSGFIYCFPIKSAFDKPHEIRGIKIMPPEFIILYKLLQWRNGDYSGWDRTKRDVADISLLMSNGLVSYDQVVNTIYEYVPDVLAQHVLIERLNTASYCDDPTKIGVRQPNLLTPERQWGTPQISDQLDQAFREFIESGARCGRILPTGEVKLLYDHKV